MTTDEITTNQHKEIFMKKKSRLMLLVSFIFMVCLSGCAKWQSVIKSQLGQPIAAFSGDDVYWEVPEDLPKMTKLMIDGKALYIHRANYQIIDKALL